MRWVYHTTCRWTANSTRGIFLGVGGSSTGLAGFGAACSCSPTPHQVPSHSLHYSHQAASQGSHATCLLLSHLPSHLCPHLPPYPAWILGSRPPQPHPCQHLSLPSFQHLHPGNPYLIPSCVNHSSSMLLKKHQHLLFRFSLRLLTSLPSLSDDLPH